MPGLIREMLHYRNSLEDGEKLDAARVEEFEKKYDEILEKARNEYQDGPPSKYYFAACRLSWKCKMHPHRNGYIHFKINEKFSDMAVISTFCFQRFVAVVKKIKFLNDRVTKILKYSGKYKISYCRNLTNMVIF